MKSTVLALILAMFCVAPTRDLQAQDNALVIANRKTKQFRHIRMNRWVMLKLKGGNKFHSWFMKGVNDSSIVMAHGHVIKYDEINNLREITEMHRAVRYAGPIFFLPFGAVVYEVGLKEGSATSVPRQVLTYAVAGICGLAATVPWVVKKKVYDFNQDWYLGPGTMPKKIFKRNLNQPKGAGGG